MWTTSAARILIPGAPQGAIGDVEEQDPERVDDGFHALDQRHARGDRDASQHERAGDPDHDHTAS